MEAIRNRYLSVKPEANGTMEYWSVGVMALVFSTLHHSITPFHTLVTFCGGRSMRLRKADVINAQPKMAKERP